MFGHLIHTVSKKSLNDPGRSRTRNLQIPLSLSHYGTFVPLTGVSFTFVRGRRPRTRSGVLESDALPLCYRAILYGTNRDLFAIKLSSFDRAVLLRAASGRHTSADGRGRARRASGGDASRGDETRRDETSGSTDARANVSRMRRRDVCL